MANSVCSLDNKSAQSWVRNPQVATYRFPPAEGALIQHSAYFLIGLLLSDRSDSASLKGLSLLPKQFLIFMCNTLGLMVLIRLICLSLWINSSTTVLVFTDEHTFITASLLEVFGGRSSVGVNQQIFTESIAVFYGRWRSLLLFLA